MKKTLIGLLITNSVSVLANDCSLSLYMPALEQQEASYQKEIAQILGKKNYGPVNKVSVLNDVNTTYLLTTEVVGAFNFQRKAIVSLFKDSYDINGLVSEKSKRTLGDNFAAFKKLIAQIPSCK